MSKDISSEAEDISSEVYGRYQCGFRYAGFDWSDRDESRSNYGAPKYGALSAPGKIRVRFCRWFLLRQRLGLIPKGDGRFWKPSDGQS